MSYIVDINSYTVHNMRRYEKNCPIAAVVEKGAFRVW